MISLNETDKRILQYYVAHPFAPHKDVAESLCIAQSTISGSFKRINEQSNIIGHGVNARERTFVNIGWIKAKPIDVDYWHIPFRLRSMVEFLECNPYANQIEFILNFDYEFSYAASCLHEIYRLFGIVTGKLNGICQ